MPSERLCEQCSTELENGEKKLCSCCTGTCPECSDEVEEQPAVMRAFEGARGRG